MISMRSFLRRNILYILGAFLFIIIVTVQVNSHQICNDCPTKSAGRSVTCDTCDTVHNHPAPAAEILVLAWSCAGFTQAKANFDLSINNLKFYNGEAKAYTGYASGHAGNKPPVTDYPIGVVFYRKGSHGGGLGITFRGTGIMGQRIVGGGKWDADVYNFNINDWRFPTSRNSAASEGYVVDWNDREIKDDSNAQYDGYDDGYMSTTSSAYGDGWIGAVCDPTSY